ncbi:MAG: hypothetical protein HRU07_07655 [Nitrosopumilus sp.]|nr:hypothetical protein [Nitrosopumilus sp.]NRA06013.1 hypothetical protein [Nitrosopumilus sp.]
MNKTLAITTIVMIAVVMGMSAIVPAMADRPVVRLGCPQVFELVETSRAHDLRAAIAADDNLDGLVCEKLICPPGKHCLSGYGNGFGSWITIDNNVPVKRAL